MKTTQTLTASLAAALLLSLTGSPAGADTGISAPPYLGSDQKPAANEPDLGTQGPAATATNCGPDLDNNGQIDFSDLVGVLTNWGRCPFVHIEDPLGTDAGKTVRGECPADINRDGYVDFADFHAVLTNYGLACETSSTP